MPPLIPLPVRRERGRMQFVQMKTYTWCCVRQAAENRAMSIAKKIRVPDLALMKERGERIAMLTAYDATMARLFDQAGVDLLLVGDSLGHVILGLESTIPVTLDQIIHHTRAVAKGATRSLVVADMPFLTYQVSP